MDPLDVRIVRAMGVLPHVTGQSAADALRPARIARDVGVTTETVRERIARLESAGVIAGYEVYPNLRHLGLDAASFFLQLADESVQDRVRDSLPLLDGLMDVVFFVGAEVCVDIAFRTPSERDRRLRGLVQVTGDAEPQPFYSWVMPPVRRTLSARDWRVLQAVRANPRRSLVDAARASGIPYRTFKRAYDRMAAEGSFFIRPIVDAARDPGLVPFALLLYFHPDAPAATAADVMHRLDDHIVVGPPREALGLGNLDLMVFASAAADVEHLRRACLDVPGVARARALVLSEIHSRGEWIDDAIATRAGPAPVLATT
jgi:DNA-binding Lrp family transcriptional regulator